MHWKDLIGKTISSLALTKITDLDQNYDNFDEEDEEGTSLQQEMIVEFTDGTKCVIGVENNYSGRCVPRNRPRRHPACDQEAWLGISEKSFAEEHGDEAVIDRKYPESTGGAAADGPGIDAGGGRAEAAVLTLISRTDGIEVFGSDGKMFFVDSQGVENVQENK